MYIPILPSGCSIAVRSTIQSRLAEDSLLGPGAEQIRQVSMPRPPSSSEAEDLHTWQHHIETIAGFRAQPTGPRDARPF